MRFRVKLALMALAFAAVCAVYLAEGENGLTFSDLCARDRLDDNLRLVIAKEIRLPRMLCAVGVGALLSLAGVVMQNVFRNDLVEPYTMGISGGAMTGVALAFTLGIVDMMGEAAVSLSACAGALLTMLIILKIRHKVGGDNNSTLLCGIMISFVSSAITTILLSLSTREQLSQIISWNIGSFVRADMRVAVAIAVIGIVATPASAFFGNVLNVLGLGDDVARGLGLSVERIQRRLFIGATVAAALSVAAAGVVAFIGMTVPHVVRIVCGDDNRKRLPAAGLCGATLALACDLVAKKILWPVELPAGAVTAILGGMVFIGLATFKKES